MSYEDLCSIDTFPFPIEARIMILPEKIRVRVIERIENSDVCKSRLEEISNAVVRLTKMLRVKMEIIDRLRKTASTHAKKSVSVFSVRAHTRSYRSPTRSRSTPSATNDDGGDNGGDSDSSDPPARRYLPHLIPLNKRQFNSFPLTVAFPRLLLCGLCEARRAA